MKRITKILIFCFSILIIVFLIFNYFGPRIIIQTKGGMFSSNFANITHNPSDFDLNASPIEISTKDNLLLKAYLIRTDSLKQKGTIILVHGIRAYKEHFFPLCKMLADSGFNSVVLDLRAHGESEGKYCTFGFYEKQDLSILVDSISKIKNLNLNIGIWGQSLGGAIALQSLEFDKRICFGIVESTFSDLRTITHDYTRNKLGFDIPFVTDYLLWRAAYIADFDPDKVVPSESCKNISQAIFMVHGTLDDRIKFEYGKQNFDNLQCNEKEFYEVKNANHLNVWKEGGDVYFTKVFEFLNRQIPN